jgi:Ca2+-binding EF-hand superfamily protein
MPFSSMPFALAGLGYQYTRQKEDPVGKEAKTVMIDFDGFIEIVDRSRAHRVTMQRRCAGFTESEISRFREKFERYDQHRTGYIEPIEAGMFVEELGFTINTTLEQRSAFLKDIETARETAKYAGVEDSGTPGGSMTFWVLVQVLRILYKQDDNKILENELRAAKEADFEQAEVDGFRSIFVDWFSQEKKLKKEAGRHNPQPAVVNLGPALSQLHHRGRPSSGRPSSSSRDRRAAPPPGASEEKELSKDSIQRLLRSMGLTITKENTCKLERKIDDLDSSGRVDFADFLRLMRWMLSTNFEGINKSSMMAAHESKA